jgi:hypothetical protein
LPHPLNRVAVAIGLVLLLGAGTAIAARVLSTERTIQLGLFDASGRVADGGRVVATKSGECFVSSLAVDGADAWRCAAGNEILDPCFQPPRGSGPLACMADPWGPVTQLRLTRRLPHATPVDSRKPMPWAVETVDELRCTKLTSASDVIGGKRVNYRCTDGSVLVGDVDDSSDQWTIERSLSGRPRSGDLERVALRRVFRP